MVHLKVAGISSGHSHQWVVVSGLRLRTRLEVSGSPSAGPVSQCEALLRNSERYPPILNVITRAIPLLVHIKEKKTHVEKPGPRCHIPSKKPQN